jgi:8-oxo-dGTP pyrophosphatase MutT (NUDIX family)
MSQQQQQQQQAAAASPAATAAPAAAPTAAATEDEGKQLLVWTQKVGIFASTVFEINPAPLPSAAKHGSFKQLRDAIVREEASHDERARNTTPQNSGAIFVHVLVADAMHHEWKFLLDLGFALHHSQTRRTAVESHKVTELVFTKWCNPLVAEDKIPLYAGSKSGVAVMVLSPNNAEVLMVCQEIPGKGPRWGFIRGSQPHGANLIATVVKEAHEETGVELDPASLSHVATYASAGEPNDFCAFFVATAKTKHEVKMDPFELRDAAWLPISLFPSRDCPPVPRLGEDWNTAPSIKYGNMPHCAPFLGSHVAILSRVLGKAHFRSHAIGLSVFGSTKDRVIFTCI